MHPLEKKLELLRLKANMAKEIEAAFNEAIVRIGCAEEMMAANVQRLAAIVPDDARLSKSVPCERGSVDKPCCSC